MVKVVLKKLGNAQSHGAGAKSAAVKTQRIQGEHGVKTITMVETSTKTFSHDLAYVFGQNVSKARRANKHVTGKTDRVPAKA